MADGSEFIEAIFGTSSGIANIRRVNDMPLPKGKRRSYNNVLDAWFQMGQHKGCRAFVYGIGPNRFRARKLGRLVNWRRLTCSRGQFKGPAALPRKDLGSISQRRCWLVWLRQLSRV